MILNKIFNRSLYRRLKMLPIFKAKLCNCYYMLKKVNLIYYTNIK